MKKQSLKQIIENYGEKYSEALSIDVGSGRDEEIFKWFLASVLFGAPIRESSAMKTYMCFQEHKVLTPEQILKTGWEGLVEILDEGTYTRYDYKTADKLLKVAQNLIDKHNGSLNAVEAQASGPRDLEKRLKDLGKGIGDVTVSIFLRDMQGIWKKADSRPTSPIIQAAKNLEIVKKDASPEQAQQQLKTFWAKNALAGKSFANFETALFRLGKNLRRKHDA